MQRFLVVDDHRLFLEGMRHLLCELGESVQIDLANSVESALCKIDGGERYDLILTDISLPEMDGYTLIQSLHERNIVLPVVMVSSSTEIADIRRCLALGASGFIHKNASSEEMLTAIKKVLAGKIALPESLQSQLEVTQQERSNSSVLTPTDCQDIGAKQLKVLALMDQGLSNKQIAQVLSITEATVKYHIGVLFKSLDVKNRTSCLRKAREQQLIKQL